MGWCGVRLGFVALASAFAATTALAQTQVSPPAPDATQQERFAQGILALKRKALEGDTTVQAELGRAYILGHGVPVDKVQGMGWLKMAADGGNVGAQQDYGYLLFKDNRYVEAAPYLQIAAEKGRPGAQFYYAFMLLTGKGVPVDRVRGRALMEQSAANGWPQARMALSKMGVPMLEAHPLVPMDEAHKQRWRDMAARNASRGAATSLPGATGPSVRRKGVRN